MNSLSRVSGAALLAFFLLSRPVVLNAAETATASLLANGDFETDADHNNWPDSWGNLKEASYENENGNHFLRLTSPEAGKTVLMYVPVNLPAGAKALSLTWRQRVSNLKLGKQSWFDARIMMNFKDAIGGQQINPGPPAPNTRRDTAGWEAKSLQFLVPEGAKVLEFMPSLLQVETGTFDLDDIVITPTDPTELIKAAETKKAQDMAREAGAAKIRQANATTALLRNGGSLLSDGDFEADKNNDAWPDDWGGPEAGRSYESEDGNHFYRMKALVPDKVMILYRIVDIPTDAKALQLSWRQRIMELKPGNQPWFDARIMMNFKDAAGKQMPGPGAPYSRGDSKGWETRTTQFLVPDGAVSLEFMPALFQVKTGTFDLDDIAIKPVDDAPLRVAAAQAAEEAKFVNVAPEEPNRVKWPAALHVVGTKLMTQDGKEVRLQGVNVVSLEWNPQGERVLRNIITATDDWHANIIRLPVHSEYWFDANTSAAHTSAAYRKLVDNVITMAANRGAYVLLDLHHFRAPRQSDLDFWKDAAARYANHPAVIFDLFNEPHGTTWEVWRDGGFVEDKNTPADEDAFLTAEEKAKNTKGFHAVGMQALLDAVRGAGAKNIVAVGGLDWAYDLSGIANGFALKENGGDGIMYATHIYPWKTDWQNKVLLVADKYPIIVGEVGASNKKMTFIPADSQEDAVTWSPKMLGLIEKYKFNWTGFSFHPSASPCLISDWKYTPTPEWGALAKRALAGEKFPDLGLR